MNKEREEEEKRSQSGRNGSNYVVYILQQVHKWIGEARTHACDKKIYFKKRKKTLFKY